MTCIVGVISDGKVYMGSDSAVATGWEVRPLAESKLFRLGKMVFGTSGDMRVAQVVKHGLVLEAQPEDNDDMAYMVNVVAECIRELLKARGISTVNNNKEGNETEFLVGYRGHLYEINTNYQVTEYSEGFNAIGCGQDYALGALYIAFDTDPEDRVSLALQAADHFSGGVCQPFHYEVVE